MLDAGRGTSGFIAIAVIAWPAQCIELLVPYFMASRMRQAGHERFLEFRRWMSYDMEAHAN